MFSLLDQVLFKLSYCKDVFIFYCHVSFIFDSFTLLLGPMNILKIYLSGCVYVPFSYNMK